MKFVRCFAIVLPIAFAVFGCDRGAPTRVVAPPSPPASVEVAEAHWVTDKAALDGAVRQAAASPLVARAIRLVPGPRLTPFFQGALRAVGRTSDGAQVGVTILPYMVGDDSTHATFLSYIEGGATQVVDIGELIAGRKPTPSETGFYPTEFLGQLVWVKDGGAPDGAAEAGQPHLSPERFQWSKFSRCLFEGAPNACISGGDAASAIAPEVPRIRVIGCAVGIAGLAIACAADALKS